jgi:ketosteroid isomerase-like protein
MSEENVELARKAFAALERWMAAYWNEPRSPAAALLSGDLEPEDEALWRCLHAEIVWDTAGFGTYRGHLEIAQAWEEIFEIADDYSTSVRELSDLGGDQVFAAVDRTITGTGSGIHATIPVFLVITVGDGLITHVAEYPERAEALERQR